MAAACPPGREGVAGLAGQTREASPNGRSPAKACVTPTPKAKEDPMLDIEQAIREVGTVYQALTGRPIQTGRAEAPPEMDGSARAQVEDRYRQFKTIIESPLGGSVGAGAGVASAGPSWAPPIVVIEHEGEVRYEIDLPAVRRDQVGVSVMGGFLVVRGERGERGGAPASGAAVRYTERAAGPFQRVIALPAQARRDGIQAALHDGVLAVTVPTDGPGGEAVAVEIR